MDGAASQSAWAVGARVSGSCSPGEGASLPGGRGRGAAPGLWPGVALGGGLSRQAAGLCRGEVEASPPVAPLRSRPQGAGPGAGISAQTGPYDTPINKHLSEPRLWQWLASGGRSPSCGQRGVKLVCGGQGAGTQWWTETGCVGAASSPAQASASRGCCSLPAPMRTAGGKLAGKEESPEARTL